MPLSAIPAGPARAAALVLLLAACGSNEASRTGGPKVNAPAPTNGKIACGDYYGTCPASIAAGGTALDSYESARPVAEATESDATWTGAFAGHAVDRAGKPTTVADSGYRFEFCSKASGHLLDFYVTKSGCSAVNLCNKSYPCGSASELPKLDVDDAIAAAYPDDPATTLYEVAYSPKYGRRWLLARKDAPNVVTTVDADTGEVSH